MHYTEPDPTHAALEARAAVMEPVWKLGVRETILGARGISKMSHFWLPLAVLLLADAGGAAGAALYTALALVAAVLCRVQFSILANDLSDSRADAVAGKRRWIALLSGPAATVVVFGFLALGYAALWAADGSVNTFAAYTVSVLLSLFYSMPPFRFKERGAAGLLTYVLSAATIYVVVPWTWFNAAPGPLAILAAAVASDKWIQIHFHQVIDHPADAMNQVPTYAVRVGLDRARSSLRSATVVATLCLLAAIAYVSFLLDSAAMRIIVLVSVPAVMTASAAYKAAQLRRSPSRASALVRELPSGYLGLTFLTFFVLPPILFSLVAAREPQLWILVLPSLALLAGISVQSHRYRYR